MKKILWALFGNDDDSIIGDDTWNPTRDNSIKTKVLWWLRNPFHNLMFYVVPFGFCNKEFTRIGTVGVFKETGGWGWALLKYKYWRMPFISYYGIIKFYIGWRERGNFGIKLTLNSSYVKTN